MFVDVKTNLPDSAKLGIEFGQPASAHNYAEARPGNGTIAVGPFTFLGGAYPPDEDVIRITSSEYQPRGARELLQQTHNEYVSDGCVFFEVPFVIGRVVVAEEFGAEWPFTVERGVVGCDWGALGKSPWPVFRHNNRTYAISGASEEFIHAMPF